MLDPEKPEIFLAWLDGAVALKSAPSAGSDHGAA